jgi:hypothetical protein
MHPFWASEPGPVFVIRTFSEREHRQDRRGAGPGAGGGLPGTSGSCVPDCVGIPDSWAKDIFGETKSSTTRSMRFIFHSNSWTNNGFNGIRSENVPFPVLVEAPDTPLEGQRNAEFLFTFSQIF